MSPFSVIVQGCQITGLMAGDAPGLPLVLLHGIGSGARSWLGQLAGLSGARRIIAWDAPGYGGSDPLAEAHPTAKAYADALASCLTALGIEQCHLLGHSLGAIMAARFAADSPHRVARLILASIALGHARQTDARRADLLEARLTDLDTLGPRGLAEKRGPRLLGPNAPADAIRAVIDTMAEVRPDGYAAAARMLSTADTLADIARLPPDLPVQILYGDADVITPPNANHACRDARPGCIDTVIAGAGHALYVENPTAFNDSVADFLKDRP